MKTFVAVCVLAAIAFAQANVQLSEEQIQKLNAHIKICIGSSAVKPELVQKARANEFVEDAALYTFFDCIFKRVGFLNDKSEFQEDVLRQKLSSRVNNKDELKIMLTTCSKYGSEPAEKRALLYYKCYKNEAAVKIELLDSS